METQRLSGSNLVMIQAEEFLVLSQEEIRVGILVHKARNGIVRFDDERRFVILGVPRP